jgi:hypothetical protein
LSGSDLFIRQLSDERVVVSGEIKTIELFQRKR